MFYPRMPKAATMNPMIHCTLQQPRDIDTCTTHGHLKSDSSLSPSQRHLLLSTDEFSAIRKATRLELIRKDPYLQPRRRISALAYTDNDSSPATETNDSIAAGSQLQQLHLFGPLPQCTLPMQNSSLARADFADTVPDDDTVFADISRFAMDHDPLLSPPSSPLLTTNDLDSVPVDDFVLFP